MTNAAPAGARDEEVTWILRLYVAGPTPRSLAAFANLSRICETHLPGQYRLEVVDLSVEKSRAVEDEILAIPALVRLLPKPVRTIIGDMSNTERVLVGLRWNREDPGA